MFKGYVSVDIMGERETMPPVKLRDAKEVANYVRLQMRLFPEVVIVDDEDYTVVHAVDGKVVFPPEWANLDKVDLHFTPQNEFECLNCGSRLIQDRKCLTCDSTNLKKLKGGE